MKNYTGLVLLLEEDYYVAPDIITILQMMNHLKKRSVLSYHMLYGTIKPVLRGHLWDKEKLSLEDMWPLNSGSIDMKFSMTGQKRWPLNTGDCLTEVTSWAGLTLYA